MPESSFQPLAGVRILDLSRVLAGPVCSMVLADLGADVIKVERPGRGDDTREWGPPFIDQPSERAGMSAYFASVNRNKRSLTLDMAHPAGREVLGKLIARSDVLLENFLPSTAAKFGLEPTQLHAINPRLIVCSISGFGRTGPWRESPGYDFVVQALSGLMAITGEQDGEPMKVGVALTDVLTGLYAAVSVLAAVYGRERRAEASESRRAGSGGPEQKDDERRKTDEACGEQGHSGPQLLTLDSQPSGPPPVLHLDLSLLDCTLASLVNVAQAFLTTGQRPVRYGNAHPQIVPYECFQTADGYIVLAVGNDDQFQRFCAAATRDDLAKEPRFATNPLRVTNRGELIAELQKLFHSASTIEWTNRLAAAQVPYAPVLSLDEIFTLPQVKARNMVVETTGGLKLVASPIKSVGNSMPAPSPPPTLGEHTDEILGEVGYSIEAIRRLREMGVI